MPAMICSYNIYLAVYIEHTLCKPALLSIACQSHVCVLVSVVGGPWLAARPPPSHSLTLPPQQNRGKK